VFILTQRRGRARFFPGPEPNGGQNVWNAGRSGRRLTIERTVLICRMCSRYRLVNNVKNEGEELIQPAPVQATGF
jgi:hypothetical protein